MTAILNASDESKVVSHRRVLGAHAQATQHVALVADGPDGNLLHPALGQAGHQRDVTQGDGRDLQPRASQGDLAPPAGRAKRCIVSCFDLQVTFIVLTV